MNSGRAAAVLLVPAAGLVAGALLLLRLHFQPPTIPRYTLEKSGGESTLSASSRFEIDLRPEGPVEGAVGARAFLVRDNEVRGWDPPFEVSRDGSLRIAGSVETLFAGVPRGDWEVAVAVGRPENLPTAPQDILRARSQESDTDAAAWRLLREHIRLGS